MYIYYISYICSKMHIVTAEHIYIDTLAVTKYQTRKLSPEQIQLKARLNMESKRIRDQEKQLQHEILTAIDMKATITEDVMHTEIQNLHAQLLKFKEGFKEKLATYSQYNKDILINKQAELARYNSQIEHHKSTLNMSFNAIQNSQAMTMPVLCSFDQLLSTEFNVIRQVQFLYIYCILYTGDEHDII